MSCHRASIASVTTACCPAQPAPTTSRVSAPCSRCRSSRSTPSRLPPQRLRQALSPNSRKRHSIPALAAAATCASSRPSCGGNSPMLREALSTTPPRFHERSGSTPHDDDLTATTAKPFACLVASQPATAQLAPTLRPPRNSRTDLQQHTAPQIRKTSANRAATPSPPLSPPRCRPQLWHPHRQIPIAEHAAPPNTCPFPRFRPLEVFGRRPQCVWKCS